jgi:hypothetical protein
MLRNSVFHAGAVFSVESVSARAFEGSELSALFISRNVASLGEECLTGRGDLEIVAFEADSHLREISANVFSGCGSLRSIVIPPLVGLLGTCCFAFSSFLQTVMFAPASRLATIDQSAFLLCESLNPFSIPASVTAIHDRAFLGSGIRSIEIEEGPVSFRVVNELLVAFEVRSLVWVIGSPESIVIPSSIEEIGPCSCAWQDGLGSVQFESDSSLRSLGQSSFACCQSLESICIPSSVEVLRECCFSSCSGLRTVKFEPESRLRVIEHDAFRSCGSLQLVSVPASVEVIGPQEGCSVSLPSHSG